MRINNVIPDREEYEARFESESEFSTMSFDPADLDESPVKTANWADIEQAN